MVVFVYLMLWAVWTGNDWDVSRVCLLFWKGIALSFRVLSIFTDDFEYSKYKMQIKISVGIGVLHDKTTQGAYLRSWLMIKH